MKKIEQYKLLHKELKDYGASGVDFIEEICLIINYMQPKSILDYGCGKGVLINELQKRYPNIEIYGYDPAIEGRDFLPVEKADLVINTDVLEHIPEDEIDDVVRQISSISQNVYFNLHHALAFFRLPNGENAHCTVKPIFWYYDLFKKYFKTQTILRGRHEWESVVLTFSIHGGTIEDYYNIINANARIKEQLILERLNKLEEKRNVLNNIFSVTNERKGEKIHKVINIFGIKFKFKIVKNENIPNFKEIRLELTNNCGCKCFMCPREKMTRKLGFMTNKRLIKILNELKYIDYEIPIHLHGSGEALLCKDLPQKIAIINKYKPNFKALIVTTLAYKLDKDWFEDIFKAGLKNIFVSLYAYDKDDYKIVHGVDKFDCVIENLKHLANLKQKYDIEVKINLDSFGDKYPCNITSENLNKKRESIINILKSMGFTDMEIGNMELHTFGNLNGNKDLPKFYSNKICSIFDGHRRDILQIDWEGNVIPCCFDMNSTVIWGNIYKQSIKKIFNSKKRKRFLDKIKNKEYIKLCEGCKEFE